MADAQIDELILLLDCGWDDAFDLELLRPLKNVIGHVHGVLITHPDPAHLGALPYLVHLLPLRLACSLLVILGDVPTGIHVRFPSSQCSTQT